MVTPPLYSPMSVSTTAKTSFYSPATLRFLLYDVFDVDQLLSIPWFSDHSKETFDMILDATDELASRKLYPLLEEMDRKEPVLKDGRIRVHPAMRALMQEYGAGGWISASAPYDAGGQQLPVTVSNLCLFILGAANYSACAFPYLSTGVANLLLSFGTKEQQARMLPMLYAGKWQGTMALTEPEAGSSLGDLITTAVPVGDGKYKLRGQKIFISAGDHDAVDNVIHLMLARIEGAPSGTRGISMFIVPRERTEGDQLVPNDVTTGGVFHKMGYKGAPIAHIILGEKDDCIGELIGEPHKGLSYMFQMMNEARVAVGLNAASIASAAYYASRNYASERRQGREFSDGKSPQQTLIENHPDVKRMLLFQKSIVEGSLSLLMQCSIWADIHNHGSGEESEKAGRLLSLLTPVAKTYPSEAGIESVSNGLQILGGYGYCQDFPLEQYYREARIHPIHEGTTGIHGMDLLGRKIGKDQGAAFRELAVIIQEDIQSALKIESTSAQAKMLGEYLSRLGEITTALGMRAMQEGAAPYLADATLYLDAFARVTVAWQWLKMGIAASKEATDFTQGKLATMRYYFEYELVKCEGTFRRLASNDRLTVEIDSRFID